MSCLAGILIVVSINMSECRSFLNILKGSLFDKIILLSTFMLTVLVDLTVAIEVGIVLSALLFMKRMADIAKHEITEFDSDIIDDYSKLPKGVSIYEISGPMFFATTKVYIETIKQLGLKSKIIIIRMRHVPFIDSTGIANFKDVIHELKESDVNIILSGINATVFKDLETSGIINKIQRHMIFNSFDDALQKAKMISN